MKVLLVEGIDEAAELTFKEAGLGVQRLSRAVDAQGLIDSLKGCSILGSRSRTEITKEILEKTDLMAVGTFCIGVNQVDLKTACERGIPVFNAPYSNTRSVAELVMAFVISLSRKLFSFSSSMHRGDWNKTSKSSFEVRGKVLGIVGYGHIGSQVSVLAESLGMKVIYYDIVNKLPIGNAKSCASLKELLSQCDFLTLHVPETEETKNMICKKELKAMKQGSFLINTSRGSVVNLEDLKQALDEKRISGAALDVFPEEPLSNKGVFNSALQNLSQVILTPHIGGSTEEAQRSIGKEVSESLVSYITLGVTESSVNFPQLSLPPISSKVTRVTHIHKNQPGVLSEVNRLISDMGVNIQGQYLSTNELVGYLVVDLEKDNVKNLCEAMEKLPFSIKTRKI